MTKNKKQQWLITPDLFSKVLEFENLVKLSKSMPIIICGPSGVGKSLFVHIFKCIFQQKKKTEPKIQTINCAAFTKELLLLEIFGHVKGAFKGKPGVTFCWEELQEAL